GVLSISIPGRGKVVDDRLRPLSLSRRSKHKDNALAEHGVSAIKRCAIEVSGLVQHHTGVRSVPVGSSVAKGMQHSFCPHPMGALESENHATCIRAAVVGRPVQAALGIDRQTSIRVRTDGVVEEMREGVEQSLWPHALLTLRQFENRAATVNAIGRGVAATALQRGAIQIAGLVEDQIRIRLTAIVGCSAVEVVENGLCPLTARGRGELKDRSFACKGSAAEQGCAIKIALLVEDQPGLRVLPIRE